MDVDLDSLNEDFKKLNIQNNYSSVLSMLFREEPNLVINFNGVVNSQIDGNLSFNSKYSATFENFIAKYNASNYNYHIYAQKLPVNSYFYDCQWQIRIVAKPFNIHIGNMNL